MPDTLSPPSGIGPAAPTGSPRGSWASSSRRAKPIDRRRASARARRARGHHDRHGRGGVCVPLDRSRPERQPRPADADRWNRSGSTSPTSSTTRWRAGAGMGALFRGRRASSSPSLSICAVVAGIMLARLQRRPRRRRHVQAGVRHRRPLAGPPRAPAALHPAAQLRARDDVERDDAGGIPADARSRRAFWRGFSAGSICSVSGGS